MKGLVFDRKNNKEKRFNLYQNIYTQPNTYSYITNGQENLDVNWSYDAVDSLSIYEFDLKNDKVLDIDNTSPNRIIIDVKISGPQFLAVSEMYYPNGWYASIDGESTEIFEVNDLIA